MLKSSEKQTLTVHNKMELGEDISVEAKGKGRKFVSRFIEPGVAHYEEFGDVLITKETLDGFINTMVGCPVIIQHKDIDDENVDKERVGVISNVWFNQFDGWYYCDGIIWDKQAIDLVKNQDWSVSCTYDFDSDKLEKTHNGKKIDMEFTGGEFLHLALVPNPRYERANIVMNAKEKDDDIEWITVHGNHIPVKKGQSKDEAVKEFIDKQKKDKSGDKDEKGEFSDYSEGRLNGEIHSLEDEIDEIDDKLQMLDDKLRKSKRAIDKYHRSMAKGYEEDIKSWEIKRDKKNQQLDKLYKEQESRKESSKVQPAQPSEPTKNPPQRKEQNPEPGKKKVDPDEFERIYRRKLKENESKIPKAYKRNEQTKSLWLYKNNIISRDEWIKSKELLQSNNSLTEKEITMSVLNELESFIKGVIKNADDEDKKEKAKNEDKRKLIDEVGGILKGKVDDEIIKTIMKKMEEASYEPSEDKKADNEADEEEKEEKFEEEKKIANKCKNEEEEKEDKKEDKVEDEDDEKDEDDEVDKEEVKNKCKNSMKDVKEIIMGGKSKIESDYISKADRFALGEKY